MRKFSRGTLFITLIGVLAVLFVMRPMLPRTAGQNEFRFNWTAACLLAHGENMYDPALVQQTQRSLTGIDPEHAFVTFSPPWVALILIPYTFLPFADAAFLWLLINLFLLGVGVAVLWRMGADDDAVARRWWIGLVAAFSFSITLTTLMVGQIAILVFAMVVAFLALERRGWDEGAGVALAGMLIKPQTLFLTILLLTLYSVRARRWRILGGLGITALGVIVALFVVRPEWAGEYLQALSVGNAIGWESSNLDGIVLALTGWMGAKFIGLMMVPFMLWLWWRAAAWRDLRRVIDVSILYSIITAPYGFSYDQVLLLVPLFSLLTWITEGRLNRFAAAGIVAVLGVANLFSFYERIQTPSEAYFFWIPLLVASMYGYAVWRVHKSLSLRVTST